MTGWTDYIFRDLLIEPVRNGIYKQKEFHGRGAKIVNMGELFSNGRLRAIEMKRVVLSEVERSKSLLMVGDLIFARRSLTAEGAGKCSIVSEITEATTFESSIIRARPNSKIASSEYLYYFFNGPYGKYLLGTILRQVAVAGITGADLMQLVLKLPPLPEQKAIASVLSSLDDKIDLLHRQNKTLEAMAETLFRQWFVEEADESWEEVTLGYFADNIRDNVKTESLSAFDTYIGLEHIPRKRIYIDSTGQTDSLGSNKSKFRYHDILFGKLRSYFHKVSFAPTHGVCSTDILVIRPKTEKLFPFCLFWFFSDEVVAHSDAGAEGTRMPRSSWSIISNYKVPKPDGSILERFNRIAVPAITKIEDNASQIRTLEKLRDTLLPKLMSGEVRVKV